MTTYDNEDTFTGDQQDMELRDHDSNKSAIETGPIDYKLYKVFWSLQRFFRTYDKAIESAAHWEKFVCTPKHVCAS